jgi:hypothetical protein
MNEKKNLTKKENLLTDESWNGGRYPDCLPQDIRDLQGEIQFDLTLIDERRQQIAELIAEDFAKDEVGIPFEVDEQGDIRAENYKELEKTKKCFICGKTENIKYFIDGNGKTIYLDDCFIYKDLPQPYENIDFFDLLEKMGLEIGEYKEE